MLDEVGEFAGTEEVSDFPPGINLFEVNGTLPGSPDPKCVSLESERFAPPSIDCNPNSDKMVKYSPCDVYIVRPEAPIEK